MSISTLSKISVPTDRGENATLLMPKLQYRFRVLFDGFGVTGEGDELKTLTRQVVDVTRPNITFEQITLDAYNSRTYLAGKHTWEPITLNLRDDASNQIQKLVGSQLQKQFDFYEQSSAVSGGSYKFITKIEILDGGNGNASNGFTIIDKYELVGCYIESANYNTLAYNTNDPVTVSLTIRYDNAIQFGQEGVVRTGVGQEIARANYGGSQSSLLSTTVGSSTGEGPG